VEDFEQIVAREDVLRTDIAKIIEEIEGQYARDHIFTC
jgi:hypothetical protein